MSKTLEQIQNTIRIARDSVWAIDDSLEKLNNGIESDEPKNIVKRNVSHLKLVVDDPDISNSGEDISDLYQAITAGESKLAELAQ